MDADVTVDGAVCTWKLDDPAAHSSAFLTIDVEKADTQADAIAEYNAAVANIQARNFTSRAPRGVQGIGSRATELDDDDGVSWLVAEQNLTMSFLSIGPVEGAVQPATLQQVAKHIAGQLVW